MHSSLYKWEEIQTTGSMKPPARSGHACVLFQKKYFFVFGGLDDKDAINDLYRFDLQQNIWECLTNTQTGSYPTRRASHAMICIDELEKIYIYGGTGSQVNQVCKSDVYQYDIVKNIWEIKGPKNTMPVGRYGHTMNHFKHSLLIFGGAKVGKKPNQADFSDELLEYNLITNEFSTITGSGAIPQGRYKHQSIIIKNTLYIIGGSTNQIRYGNISAFDLSTRGWRTITIQKAKLGPKLDPILFKGRFAHGLYHDEDELFIYGGIDEKPCGDILKLDLDKQSFIKHHIKGDHPPIRSFFSSAYCDTFFILFGGRIGEKKTNDLYIYKGKHDKLTYKECDLPFDMINLMLSEPDDNLANVQINCIGLEKIYTYYAHSYILKHRWQTSSKLLKLTASGKFEISIPISPKIFEFFLRYIYGADAKFNLLEKDELLSLLEFLIEHDQRILLIKLLRYILLSTKYDEVPSFLDKLQSIRKKFQNNESHITLNLIIVDKAIKLFSIMKEKTNNKNDQDTFIREIYKMHFDLDENQLYKLYYDDFKKLKNDTETADFEILFENNPKSYKVHSAILIARSNYFTSLFQGNMREANQRVIKLKSFCESEVFDLILEYFYAGYHSLLSAKSNITPDIAFKLLRDANYLDLKGKNFMIMMENLVMEIINQNNLIQIIDIADKIHIARLKQQAIEYLCQNFKSLTNQNQEFLKKLPKEVLVEIIKELGTYVIQHNLYNIFWKKMNEIMHIVCPQIYNNMNDNELLFKVITNYLIRIWKEFGSKSHILLNNTLNNSTQISRNLVKFKISNANKIKNGVPGH